MPNKLADTSTNELNQVAIFQWIPGNPGSLVPVGGGTIVTDAGGQKYALLSISLAANSSVNVNQVGGAAIAEGQTTMANSLPVVIASNQTAVPENLTQIAGAALALGQAAMAASIPVVVASNQTAIPVTVPVGQAAMAASTPVVIASNQSNVPANIAQVGGAALAEGQTTMANSLPVAIASNQSAVPVTVPVGQAAMAASTPVVIASNQSAVPVTVPLGQQAMAASTPVVLASNQTSIPVTVPLGQAAMAASTPVVVASDQTAMPVKLSAVTVLNSTQSAQNANGNAGDSAVGPYKELAFGTNISAISGAAATLTMFLDVKGPDGIYYQVISSSGLVATGSTFFSVGAGGQAGGGVTFGSTVRVRWTISGTTPSITFTTWLIGK